AARGRGFAGRGVSRVRCRCVLPHRVLGRPTFVRWAAVSHRPADPGRPIQRRFLRTYVHTTTKRIGRRCGFPRRLVPLNPTRSEGATTTKPDHNATLRRSEEPGRHQTADGENHIPGGCQSGEDNLLPAAQNTRYRRRAVTYLGRPTRST